MGTGLKLLRGVACHLRSSTLVFHCTDEVTEVQRGEETGSGLHSKYFHPRDSEDGQEERESEAREVLYLSTSLEVICPPGDPGCSVEAWDQPETAPTGSCGRHLCSSQRLLGLQWDGESFHLPPVPRQQGVTD